MNPGPVRRLAFTDLDGTLLDSRTYRCDEAVPALESLEKNGIPLVFCSSKTRAEVVALREQAGNGHPFVVENGGGIYIPEGYFGRRVGEPGPDGYEVISLGQPYWRIRDRFLALKARTGVDVRGFGDMDDAEVARLTGLSFPAAKRARLRDFEEPFVFPGEESAEFLRAVEADGLRWTRGRLYHLMGDHDKGRAVEMLKRLYGNDREPLDTIGLGDGLNDLPMLRVVDEPVLIRHPDGSYDPGVALAKLVRTRLAGPAGWNEAVSAWLARGGVEGP